MLTLIRFLMVVPLLVTGYCATVVGCTFVALWVGSWL